MAENYTSIDNNYDNFLNRVNSNNPGSGSVLTSSVSGGSGGDSGSAGSSETSTPPTVSGISEDLWIRNWIKSVNYSPKTQGFMLDGINGYIEANKLYIGSGGITGGLLNIPDGTTVNSFHVDAAGNTWWGTNVATGYATANSYVLNTGVVLFKSGTIGGWSISANAIYFDGATDALSAGMVPADYPLYAGKKYADRATAPFRVTPAGALFASSVEITGKITAGVGSSIASDYLSGIIAQANLNVSNRGWVQTSVFSLNGSTPATQVDWAAGTFTSADGTAYSIGAGNTGVMSAKTYIYLDTAVSTTAYQKTTTATTAVGTGKVLVAIAQNGTGEATYTVLGGQGGLNIDASNIVALSITANEIAASTITSGKLSVSQLSAITADLGAITAGTITLPNTGYIRGGQTDYQTGTGFFLGYSGAAYKFSIGNPAGHYLAWSGANDKLDLKSDIIVDAIFYNKRYIYTAFESLDGWVQSKSGTGNIAPNLGEFYLDTGSTISSIADVHCESFQEGTAINFAKNPYFQTAIRLSAITNQTIYITNGSYDLDGFGFKISNGTLYSLHIKDGTEYTTEITGITLTNWNTYKVSYTSGTNIKFYVNDVLKVTATTNLPVATDVLERFRYSITNTAAERKYLFAQYLLLNQDL